MVNYEVRAMYRAYHQKKKKALYRAYAQNRGFRNDIGIRNTYTRLEQNLSSRFCNSAE